MLGLNNTSTAVLEALLQSPQAMALADKQARDVSARRKALVTQRGEVEAQAIASWNANSKALEDAVRKHEAAKAAVRDAEREVAAAATRRSSGSAQVAASIERIEAELRATSSPLIAEFIAQMWIQWEATQKTLPITTSEIVRNPNTGTRAVVAGKPVILPKHRMEAIREVIAAAEGLKLEADQSQVPAKLAEMKASLPIVGAEIPKNSPLEALRALAQTKLAA